MNKLTILFLTMLLTCLPMAMMNYESQNSRSYNAPNRTKKKEMIPDTLRELFL